MAPPAVGAAAGPSRQSVGFKEPDDVSIKEAIAANDEFINELERIRNAAQGLTLERDDD